MKPKKCELCGDIFIPTSGRQKCCNKLIIKQCIVCGQDFDSKCARNTLSTCENPECKKQAANGVNIFNALRKCAGCGEEFSPKRRTQQYCCREVVRKCLICGKEFSTVCNETASKTCSHLCQGLFAKQQRELNLQSVTRICKWCGKEFTPKDFNDVYCQGKHYKTCEICGKEFEIDVKKEKDTRTCSSECKGKLMSQNHDYEQGSKTYKKTMLERYGVQNAMLMEGAVDKIKQTNLERYGTEWYTQTEEYRQRVKQTDLEKYGVEHHLQSEEVIAKREQTNLEKYGSENIFSSEIGKQLVREGLQSKYGVINPSQNAESKSKATRNAKNSKLELKICALLDNYNIQFARHYFLKSDNMSHEFDFYIPQYKLLIDADGLYFHGYLNDSDGGRVRTDYDAIRLQLVPKDHIFQVLVEDSEERQLKELIDVLESLNGNLDEYHSKLFDWCRSIDFPYPEYTEKRLKDDYKSLCNYHNDKYAPQATLGLSTIRQYHKSIFDAKVNGNLSIKEAWNNDELLRKVIKNRLIYKNDVDPYKVMTGFYISKIAPKISVFNPVLARYLTLKYLSDYKTICDPFSGYSGRLLGVTSTGKEYIGHDLNSTTIAESNKIIKFHNLNAIVTQQNILQAETCNYDALLTCPPYSTKEIYGTEQTFKTCDAWIDEVLNRYKCNKYVFVVDKTEKYKDYIVEELHSVSHLNKVSEYVVVI